MLVLFRYVNKQYPVWGKNKIHQLSRRQLVTKRLEVYVQQTQGIGNGVSGFTEGEEKYSLRTNNVFYIANRV